jgi:D-galactose 1-dehydrogenase
VSRIAIALAGYGKIARDQHERAIAQSADFELVAVADPAARHPSLPSYDSLPAMLAAQPEIAAVSLCMPPASRSPVAVTAVTAGRHVLLEKPPGVTLREAEELVALARRQGVTLYTAWHSQHAAGVDAARDWLRDKEIAAVRVNWKEDVRVWHPGQAWIWRHGGFGVFDPGINALSILTTILPGELRLVDAELQVPANCATPIAARLHLAGADFPVRAEFDFRQTGPQSWDIEVETASGRLVLQQGGNVLVIDGERQETGREAEYARLYSRFAELIRSERGEADLAPLRLVLEAMENGRAIAVDAFEDAA